MLSIFFAVVEDCHTDLKELDLMSFWELTMTQRLQGFPEEFIIPVSDTQAYQQFGNSVAVPVIYAIAEEILKVLDESKL